MANLSTQYNVYEIHFIKNKYLRPNRNIFFSFVLLRLRKDTKMNSEVLRVFAECSSSVLFEYAVEILARCRLKRDKKRSFFSFKTFWFFSTYLILNLYFLAMFIPTLYLSENSGPSLLTSPVSRMIPFGRKPNNVWSRLIDEKITSSIRYNNNSIQ